MGELTNFGFYKPAEGEDGWASQVNNNADLLEDAFNANKTIPAINTERVTISNYSGHADYVVERVESNNTHNLYDGETNELLTEEETDVAKLLQDQINADSKSRCHIHFKSSDQSYIFLSTVTLDYDSLLVTGEGKNKTLLSPGNSANINLFETSNTNAAIYTFQNLKFSGNKNNNTSGSAIVNSAANELQLHHVEIRSFAEYAVIFQPDTEYTWNIWTDAWILDNESGGVKFEQGGGGDVVEEFTLTGCTLSGGEPVTEDTGKPAIDTSDGGVVVKNLVMNGGTLKGSDTIDLTGVENVLFNGVQSRNLKGNYTFSIGEGADTATNVDIKNCAFRADATTPVTNFVKIGNNADEVTVERNRFVGSSGDNITVSSGATNVRTQPNEGEPATAVDAYLSANQTATASSATKVAYDATNTDSRGEFDTVNNEFVPDEDGIYSISVAATLTVNSDGQYISLRLSAGGTEVAREDTNTGGASAHTLEVTRTVSLDAGDTVSASVFNGDASDDTLDGRSSRTWFSVSREDI